MSRFVVVFEALALVAMGCFMFWLAYFGPYWHYLNPKFTHLTSVCGAVLALLGVVRIFGHVHAGGGGRGVVLAVFVLACTWSVSGNSIVDIEEDTSFTNVAESSQVEPVLESEKLGGREYVRMNVAEVLSLKQSGAASCPDDIVVRGLLLNGTEAGGAGVDVLARVAIVCCLADSVGAGLRLNGELPDPDGQWVKVYGRLVKTGHGQISFRLPGAVTFVADPEYTLEVERFEECEAPAVPFIFEFRDKAPFAY